LAAAVADRNKRLDELDYEVHQQQAHVALLKDELSREYVDKIYLLAAAQGGGQGLGPGESAARQGKKRAHRQPQDAQGNIALQEKYDRLLGVGKEGVAVRMTTKGGGGCRGATLGKVRGQDSGAQGPSSPGQPRHHQLGASRVGTSRGRGLGEVEAARDVVGRGVRGNGGMLDVRAGRRADVDTGSSDWSSQADGQGQESDTETLEEESQEEVGKDESQETEERKVKKHGNAGTAQRRDESARVGGRTGMGEEGVAENSGSALASLRQFLESETLTAGGGRTRGAGRSKGSKGNSGERGHLHQRHTERQSIPAQRRIATKGRISVAAGRMASSTMGASLSTGQDGTEEV